MGDFLHESCGESYERHCESAPDIRGFDGGTQRWFGLSEQFRAFREVDFRRDYAATIIGVSALK